MFKYIISYALILFISSLSFCTANKANAYFVCEIPTKYNFGSKWTVSNYKQRTFHIWKAHYFLIQDDIAGLNYLLGFEPFNFIIHKKPIKGHIYNKRNEIRIAAIRKEAAGVMIESKKCVNWLYDALSYTEYRGIEIDLLLSEDIYKDIQKQPYEVRVKLKRTIMHELFHTFRLGHDNFDENGRLWHNNLMIAGFTYTDAKAVFDYIVPAKYINYIQCIFGKKMTH